MTDLAVRVPQSPRVAIGGRALLQESDFTYVGYFETQTAGLDSPFIQGLTHRYVGGTLRLLYLDLVTDHHKLTEIAVPDDADFGDLVTTPTNTWLNLRVSAPIYSQGRWVGLWWDASAGRFWTVSAGDYPAVDSPVEIYTVELNSDGTCQNLHGPIGLEGIPDRRIYGGVQAVPAWFQSVYGVGAYAAGWGGYTSLVAQHGSASLGPTMYLFPDVAGYANAAEIPNTDWKRASDCWESSGIGDWYDDPAPTAFDRGIRVSLDFQNYFEGGYQGAEGYPPPNPPVPESNWLTPAPDGYGRWSWGDSYYNTGCWIDGPSKHGFLAIANLAKGQGWYQDSTMHYTSREFEFHVYDPAHYGEVINATRAHWNVKPVHLWIETFSGLPVVYGGNGPLGQVAGATYDPVSGRLYVLGSQGGGTFINRVYVYDVAA